MDRVSRATLAVGPRRWLPRGTLEIEIHQLDQRYAALRRQDSRRERALLASLSEIGQQAPVVVVRADASAGGAAAWVLVDGYKRVRALTRLSRDTALAVVWELTEPEALLLSQAMRSAEAASALEQGWLLRELRDRFGLSAVELRQRFDKSASWVSRRLGLVEELPEVVQELVRAGRIVPHAAMKHLLPLARANAEGCAALSPVIGEHRLSSRQIGVLCRTFCAGTDETRQLVLAAPLVVLRAQVEATAPKEKTAAERLVADLGAIAGISRRARTLVDHEPLRDAGAASFKRLRYALQAARAEAAALFGAIFPEVTNAGPGDADGDPHTA